MKRLNVMVVFGTRPEAIKMAPLVHELRKHPDRIRPVVVLTAQHREMLDQVMDVFHLRADYDLDVMIDNQSLTDTTCSVLKGLEKILHSEDVDFVLVQGDTTTTFAASLSAFYHRIPVGHVEAGLRTGDRYFPFPEEINRILASRLSTIHFAPTPRAERNLLEEGVPKDSVLVTGNTVIDALLTVVNTERVERQRQRDNEQGSSRKRILVTAHRRESHGEPLEAICRSLLDIVERHREVDVLFPVHPNPRVRKTVHKLLAGRDRIVLCEPLGYREFAHELAACYLVLTDSGGIQEEAPALGKPVLVLRNETERPEGIEAGTCRLVGTNYERIICEVENLLCNDHEYAKMSCAVNPYGDGKASQRIVSHILNHA